MKLAGTFVFLSFASAVHSAAHASQWCIFLRSRWCDWPRIDAAGLYCLITPMSWDDTIHNIQVWHQSFGSYFGGTPHIHAAGAKGIQQL